MTNKKSMINTLSIRLKDFVQTIGDCKGNVVDIENLNEPLRRFSISPDQSIVLRGRKILEEYNIILDDYSKELRKKHINRRDIEKCIQNTITEIVYQEKSIDTAIKDLNKTFNSQSTPYTVFYPVYNLENLEEVISFGQLKFASKIGDLNPLMTHSIISESIESFSNPQFVCITVNAFEHNSAEDKGRDEIERSLYVLNFCNHAVLRQKTKPVTLVQDSFTDSSVCFTLNEQNSEFKGKIQFPYSPFPILSLLKTNRILVSKIDKLIQKNNRNDIEERLVSAMQWVGRSLIVQLKGDAFLFNAIALESLIMEESPEFELGYRLKIRIAHLVGKDTSQRMEIIEQVSRLYGIRSKIVHRGKYEVTDIDVQQIQRLATICILRILLEDPFSSMTKHKEIVDWFNEQLLK